MYSANPNSVCADCAGCDVEWMYRCKRHGLEYCRGCSCPECDMELYDDDTSEPLTIDEWRARDLKRGRCAATF